jgi:hypothetical protein
MTATFMAQVVTVEVVTVNPDPGSIRLGYMPRVVVPSALVVINPVAEPPRPAFPAAARRPSKKLVLDSLPRRDMVSMIDRSPRIIRLLPQTMLASTLGHPRLPRHQPTTSSKTCVRVVRLITRDF